MRKRKELPAPAPVVLPAPGITTNVDAVVTESPETVPAADLKTVSKLRAVKFVDLVKEGVAPAAAARQVGDTVAKLEQDVDVKALVGALIEEFTFEAGVRKKLARAKANQIMLTGADKDAINALKIVAADPEVGITTQAPLIAQQFISRELTDFMAGQEIPADWNTLNSVPVDDTE